MKYLCTDPLKEAAGLGNSLEEAHQAYEDNAGDFSPSECLFYSLGELIKVEVKLIPKTEVVITEAGRLPKSKGVK